MKSTGFSGFESIQSLINNNSIKCTDRKGIYFVLKDIGKVELLKASIGGSFQGKDPTVSVQLLNDRWVEGPLIIYKDNQRRILSSNFEKTFGTIYEIWAGITHWALGRQI